MCDKSVVSDQLMMTDCLGEGIDKCGPPSPSPIEQNFKIVAPFSLLRPQGNE